MTFEQYTQMTKNAFLFAIHTLYTYFRYFCAIAFIIIGFSFSFLLLVALLGMLLLQDKLFMIQEYLVQVKHAIHTAAGNSTVIESTVATMPAGILPALFVIVVVCLIAGMVIYGMLNASYVCIGLRAIDTQEISLQHIHASWRHAIALALAMWLYHITVFFGFLLFILPGVWLMLACQFYGQVIVDKNSGIIDSLRTSFALTRSHILYLFVVAVMVYTTESLLSVFSGPLIVLMSLLLVTPFNILFFTYLYRQLNQLRII